MGLELALLLHAFRALRDEANGQRALAVAPHRATQHPCFRAFVSAAPRAGLAQNSAHRIVVAQTDYYGDAHESPFHSDHVRLVTHPILRNSDPGIHMERTEGEARVALTLHYRLGIDGN